MKSLVDSVDVSTRGKRRKAVTAIIKMLDKIHYAEMAYMHRIPTNLQSGEAYEAAEYSADSIEDAINTLYDAY